MKSSRVKPKRFLFSKSSLVFQSSQRSDSFILVNAPFAWPSAVSGRLAVSIGPFCQTIVVGFVRGFPVGRYITIHIHFLLAHLIFDVQLILWGQQLATR